jgi:tetraacyldisaccharide 4'-kinase
VLIRNWFFDHSFLKTVKVAIPVISIGNISTGGTGKTPFLIYIAEYYLKKEKTVGIISRGFGRDSKGLILVSDGKNIYFSPSETGDEVFMMANILKNKFSNFIIISSSDRVEASNYLINNFKCDLILLDDAFQHRKIFRNLDIILIDGKRFDKYSEKLLMPAGNLREPLSSIGRCNLIILNHKFSNNKLINNCFLKYDKPIINIFYKLKGFCNYRDEYLNVLNKKAILFCGIAEPKSFIEIVRNSGLNVLKTIIFRDHKNYTITDIDKFKKYYLAESIFVTTEKDYVKLLKFNDFIEKYPIYFLMMDIDILTNELVLKNRLDKLLDE